MKNYKLIPDKASLVLNNEVNGKHIVHERNLTDADAETLIAAGFGDCFEKVKSVAVVSVEPEQEVKKLSK